MLFVLSCVRSWSDWHWFWCLFWSVWYADVIDTHFQACPDYRMSPRSHRELSWPFIIIPVTLTYVVMTADFMFLSRVRYWCHWHWCSGLSRRWDVFAEPSIVLMTVQKADGQICYRVAIDLIKKFNLLRVQTDLLLSCYRSDWEVQLGEPRVLTDRFAIELLLILLTKSTCRAQSADGQICYWVSIYLIRAFNLESPECRRTDILLSCFWFD